MLTVRLSEFHRLAVYAYIENQSNGHQRCDDGCTAAGKERKGNTGNRHKAHGHGQIFKNLEQEHTYEAYYNQSTIQVFRVTDNSGEPPVQQAIQENYHEASQETQFFTDHGEDKVRLLYGNKVQLFL